jgi:hypothetical protein
LSINAGIRGRGTGKATDFGIKKGRPEVFLTSNIGIFNYF